MKKVLWMAASAVLVTGAVQAGVITIGDAGWNRLFDTTHNGAGNALQQHIVQVGTKGISTGYDVNGGYAFQLTGVSAPEDLEAVDFSVTYTGKSGSPDAWNVDIYVTRVGATSVFQNNDYESGTLLMEDFVTASSATGVKSLDAGGQTALLSYLQSNWVENDYLFITLKSDPVVIDIDANNHYNFSSGVEWTAEGSDAQLSVTTFPEPATLGLVAAFGGGILFIRRRLML